MPVTRSSRDDRPSRSASDPPTASPKATDAGYADRGALSAAGVPRDGDHHVLSAPLPDLHVVHGLRPGEPAAARFRRTSSASTTTSDRHEQAEYPELRVHPAALLQPLLGVLQRHHPRGSRRRHRPRPQRQRAALQEGLSGLVHPPRDHSADHRGDGLAAPVRRGQRARSTWRSRASASCSSIPPDAFRIDWLGQVDDPISFIPLPLAYFALLAANTWLGWPLNSVVATGALQSIPPRSVRGGRDGRGQRLAAASRS